MKRWIYLAGRAFQVIGLMALPSSIWVGHFDQDEQSAIAILVASLVVFYMGYWMVRFAMK